MSASRWSASSRRAATSPRTPLELIAIDFEPLAAVIDPAQAARAGAPLLHEEAGTNVLVAREFKRGDVDAAMRDGAGARQRPLPHAPQDRARDRAARVPCRIRAGPRRADPSFGDAGARHRARRAGRRRSTCRAIGCAWSRRTSAAASAARARSIRRRFSSARRRGSSARGQMDQRPHGGPRGHQPGLRRDRRCRARRSIATADAVALRADVIGDVGAYSIYPWTAALEPVQVVSFLPGPYRIEHYRGRVRAVATSKAPTGPYRGVGRPISTFVMERLMDMAAARLGIDAEGHPRCAISSRPEEFPYKIASGIVWDKSGFVECLNAACDQARLRRAAPQAGGGARGRPLVRHRHRLLRRADRHRLAHFGRARHADQHRHRDRDHPHRFDRRGHGRVRRRVARPGAGDDARAGRRRASRRARRGHPRRAGRQRRRAGRHRHLCEPQHGAGRRRRAARRRGRAREGRSTSPRICSKPSTADLVAERRTRDASPAPTVR